jgi:limonene-1,2-epoxide hydrolase
MRALFIAALLFALPATTNAQDTATAALAANWRSVDAFTAASFDAACTGAQAELDALDAALPRVLTPESLSRVRTLRGLAIIPADDVPGGVYLFAPPALEWLTSGLATVQRLDETEGFFRLTDAAGVQVAVQRGAAGGRPVLRLRGPDNAILSFVGCVPIA